MSIWRSKSGSGTGGIVKTTSAGHSGSSRAILTRAGISFRRRIVMSLLASWWREAPYLAQLGVVVIALGTLGDVAAHALHPGQGFTVPQQTAHLVILLGMV